MIFITGRSNYNLRYVKFVEGQVNKSLYLLSAANTTINKDGWLQTRSQLYVYKHVCVFICAHTYTNTHSRTHAHTYNHLHTSTYVDTESLGCKYSQKTKSPIVVVKNHWNANETRSRAIRIDARTTGWW